VGVNLVTATPGPTAVSAAEGNYSSTIAFTNTTNGTGNTSVSSGLVVFRGIEPPMRVDLTVRQDSTVIGSALPAMPYPSP
jgi:hypothetical protein